MYPNIPKLGAQARRQLLQKRAVWRQRQILLDRGAPLLQKGAPRAKQLEQAPLKRLVWSAMALLSSCDSLLVVFLQGAEPSGTQGGEDDEGMPRGDQSTSTNKARRRRLVAMSDDEEGDMQADLSGDADLEDKNDVSASGAYIERVGVVDGGCSLLSSLHVALFSVDLVRFAPHVIVQPAFQSMSFHLSDFAVLHRC